LVFGSLVDLSFPESVSDVTGLSIFSVCTSVTGNESVFSAFD
jgi:hypothetical protein